MAMDKAQYIEREMEAKIFFLAIVGGFSKKLVTLVLEEELWNFQRAATALYLEKYKVYIHWKLFLIDKQIHDMHKLFVCCVVLLFVLMDWHVWCDDILSL